MQNRRKRKLTIIFSFTILVLFVIFLGLVTPTTITVHGVENNRGIALIDGETGMLIYGENQDVQKEMASTTKIFTAYFLLEKCQKDGISLKSEYKIKPQWTGIEGSSVYLMPDEVVSIEELLYGLMLRSGNDCAVALAEIVFGSEGAYVEYANKRLKEMGFEKTTLQNPHGLPAQNHQTTAKELAQFSALAMKNPDFAKIVSSKSYNGKRTHYANKNKILQNVEGGNGVKTGYTKSAGRCLVSACKRDGKQIVLATLNTYDMFERSKAHLDSFFQKYEYIDISGKLEESAIPLDILGVKAEIGLKSQATQIPVPKGEDIRVDVKTLKELPFYTKSGKYVGNIEIYAGNRLIFNEKLYTIKTSDVI
ncbi:MAG: D-alanyl-D-alanine carboxypeptidase family protein [Bacillota bacterium]